MVILPNLNRRFSGITATVCALAPNQQARIDLVTVGTPLPVSVVHWGWFKLLFHLHSCTCNGEVSIWHARRNIEMLAGVLLKHWLGLPLHLIFTSTAQRKHSWWTKFLYRRMDTLLSTSPRAASWLEKVPDAIIPHGVDTAIYRPPADKAAAWKKLGLRGRLGIGIFGRVRPQKGIREFVYACCEVLPHFPDVSAVIVGETTLAFQSFERELKDYITDRGLQDRFYWLGKRPFAELPDLFAAMSLVACVPHNEGFGLTCLEALACGAAVVATRTGGFEMVIEPGKQGLLVPCADNEALGRALYELLADEQNLEAMGIAGVERVRSGFTIHSEADALIEIYRNSVAR